MGLYRNDTNYDPKIGLNSRESAFLKQALSNINLKRHKEIGTIDKFESLVKLTGGKSETL